MVPATTPVSIGTRYISTDLVANQRPPQIKTSLVVELTVGESRIHRNHKLLVIACAANAVFNEFHGFDRVHIGDVFAENNHTL